MRYLVIFLLLFVFGCDGPGVKSDPPKSYFTGSFPKRNTRLDRQLGKYITVKRGRDTITFNFYSNADTNVIASSRDGTIFTGKVSRSWFDYYLSEKISDSIYRISTIRIRDNLIWGLDNPMEQMFWLDSLSKNKKFAPMVQFADTTEIRWANSSKKDIRKLYDEVVAHTVPDTIITTGDVTQHDLDKYEADDQDSDAVEIVSRIYPNPAHDKMTIELAEKINVHYQIRDVNGKLVKSGTLNEQSTQIDISSLPNGTYHLNLVDRAEIPAATFVKTE